MKNTIARFSQFLLLAFIFPLFLSAQGEIQKQKIPTGDRPAIDYSSVPADAYYPGLIQVKFKPEMETNLKGSLIPASRSGLVELNHMEVDELNKQFNITQYKALLHGLYTSRSFNPGQLEQHRDHGLHLWYELELGGQESIVEVLQAFNNLDVVEVAEPVFIKKPIDPVSTEPIGAGDPQSHSRWSPADEFYSLQWGFKNTGQSIQGVNGTAGADIKAEEAWDIVTGNPDIIVAVIDEGTQYDHPDLAANMWSGIGPDGNNTVAANHGTHVSGTIAALSNNDIGVSGTAGGDGSPGSGVKIMSIDIFQGSHGMNSLELNVYAVDNGAVISQNSWGYTVSGVYNQSDLDGIDYFNDNAGGPILDGGITIFAAGNSDDDGDWYPAFYPGAMAVASTTNKDEKSSFSNFGSWIDLAAPGSNIASLGAGGNYYWMSGTSMACPHVSGVAALLLSHSPGTLTNLELWNLLVDHTDNIDAENPSHVGLLGTGRLNAIASLNALINNQGPTHTITATAGNNGSVTPSENVSVVEGANKTFTIEADAGYAIEDVLVDGNSVGAVGTYTFTNVTQNHTLSASFIAVPGYIISATAGVNGSISPLGDVSVVEGADQTFTIEADAGYAIEDVLVDGNSVGAVSTYTFTNVTENHTLSASFIAVSGYIITATAGANGSISPSGDVSVAAGADQTFNIEADAGYAIEDVLVNGNSVGAVNNITFLNVTANQTLSASFISESGYNITATAGANGSISPSGVVSVAEGTDQTFTIQPDGGYVIEDVLVNGSSVGAVSTFTFVNVTQNHSLSASFIPAPNHIISATSGTNGSISPSGNVSVAEGTDQTFTIEPDVGYEIEIVEVDGISIGAVNSYTFSNVTQNHTIFAGFVEQAPDPCLITILPHSEDFNAADLPDCWESNSTQGNLNWQSGAFSGGLSNGGSNYTYANATGNSTQSADLVSPSFDFSSQGGVELEFIHYYKHFRSLAVLSYSTDGGNQWQTIQTWNSSSSNPATFKQEVSGVAGESNVMFKWTFEFDGGGNPRTSKSWSVDDITVNSTDPAPEYTITATSGTGGTISPSGSVTVTEGNDQTFNIAAEPGYVIDDVVVDNISMGGVNSYTFTNVTENHSIEAFYLQAPAGPCVYSDLPYAENFDGSSNLPDCWDAELISGSGAAWQVGTFSGGLSGTSGNYAYVSIGRNSARNTDLYSPEFDLSNRENIAVDFTYFYDHFRSSAGFYYSIDGGNNWTQLENWNSSSANPANYSNGLPELDGQSSVIFRWNFNFTGGGNPNISKSFSVDDFEITGNTINQTRFPSDPGEFSAADKKAEDISITVFPNPTKNVSFFKTNKSMKEVHFDVFNSTGQLVERIKFNDINASAVNKLDLSELPEGMYILRIQTDTETFTENILIIN